MKKPNLAKKRSRNLTVPELAVELGITQRAAWQRIYRKQIPHRRWGRSVIIPRAELDEFLAALPGTSAQEAIQKVDEVAR